MKKLNFKKLFVFALLSVVPVTFCGCELSDLTAFEKNMGKYLGQTVATVSGENSLKLSLEDLIIAFNSYGYEYETNDGLSREEAIKETLEYEIQRRLAIAESKSLYESSITNAERNIVWQNTYNYVNNVLAQYEKEIREEKGISTPADSEEEETAEKTKKETYTPKAFVVNGEIVLNEEAKDNGYTGNPNAELIGNTEDLYGSFMKYRKISTQEISDLALTRYISNLKANEEGRRLSTADKDVLTRELKRIYDVQEGNLYVQKLQTEYYKQNLITKQEVIDYYKSLVKASYDKYNLTIENYYSDMTDDSSKVYYHPDNEFKYVTHILVQYTEEQTAQIEKWKSDLNSGRISQADYDSNMAWIKTQLATQARDSEGNLYGNSKNVSAIFNEVKNAVNGAENKAEAFNKLIYKYNSDPGIMNTDYNYVVGNNHSAMVEEFNITCRNLFKLDALQIVDENTNIAYTEYGAHIIMFVGNVENVISYSNLENITIDKLASVKLQAGEDKTLFDKLYDELYSSLSSTRYSSYQTNLIDSLKEGLTIKYNKNVYKALMK